MLGYWAYRHETSAKERRSGQTTASKRESGLQGQREIQRSMESHVGICLAIHEKIEGPLDGAGKTEGLPPGAEEIEGPSHGACFRMSGSS